MDPTGELRRRIEALPSLPSLPGVVLELLELCTDDEVPLSEIARLIGQDPALAAKLLRLVNSPFYGQAAPVTRISQAVTLLGVNAVRTLALSFSLVAGVRASRGLGFDHDRYWRRSLIAAVAAAALGTAMRLRRREDLFLAGLLQDIGMLALAELLPDSYGSLVAVTRGDHLLLQQLEVERLGVDHAVVSGLLATFWNLPPELVQAAAASHDLVGVAGPAPAAGEATVVLRCVALSGLLADIWLVDQTRSAYRAAVEACRAVLGLEQRAFEAVLTTIAETLPELAELFEVDIGGPAQAMALLERARQALVNVTLRTTQEALELATLNRALAERSQRDGLTGLYGRAHLDELLARAHAAAIRERQPLSLLFFDVDEFKRINDGWGHQVGDQVLLGLARVLAMACGPAEFAGRFGGDEFVVVAPGADPARSEELAQRICRLVAEQGPTFGRGAPARVAISVGLATGYPVSSGPSIAQLLRAADQALYDAKLCGGNCVRRRNPEAV